MAKYEVFYRSRVFELGFRFGGCVEASDPEDAWVKIQNVDEGHEVKDALCWPHGPETPPLHPREDRSLMVGDVLRTGDVATQVGVFGFREFEGSLPSADAVVTFEDEVAAEEALSGHR